MPYAEVMYRCNAHYFINVLRNRVILLVTLVAVAQLFVFSFYLHSSGPVSHVNRSRVTEEAEIHEAALFVQQNRVETFPAEPEAEEEAVVAEEPAPVAPPSGGHEIVEAKVNEIPQSADREPGIPFMKPEYKKLGLDLLKNALKQGSAGQDPTNNVIGVAAKMLAEQYGNSGPEMKKLGMNLLKSAFVAKKSQPGKRPDDSDSQMQNYAQIAKMGLDMFNSMNSKTQQGNAAAVPKLLETAAKLMDGQQNNGEIAKLGLNLLSNSLMKGRGGDDGTAAMLNMAAMMFGNQQKKKKDFRHEIRKRDLSSEAEKEQSLGSRLVSSAADFFLPPQTNKYEKIQLLESEKLFKKYINYTVEKLGLQPIKSSIKTPYKVKNSINVVDISMGFPINEPVCKSDTSYIVIVTSAVDHFNRRQAARDTWILDLVYESTEVKTVFLVGRTDNAEHQIMLEEESQKYHDIIQADFADSYKNLPLKSLALLKWVHENCPDVEHILKSDDDVFVNAPKMISILDQYHDVRSLYGSLVSLTEPQRDPVNKYYISKDTWPWKNYPPFLLGGSYIIGAQAVPQLLAAAQVTPLFELEDVYITGLCAPAGRVKRVNVEGIYHQSYVDKIDACTIAQYASWQTSGTAAIREAWKEAQRIRKADEKCNRNNCVFSIFNIVCIA